MCMMSNGAQRTLACLPHVTLRATEERMEILMSALWRGVFMNNESIKEPHVRVIAEYMDSELADVYEIDAVRGACLA